jgi:hypothetical protein
MSWQHPPKIEVYVRDERIPPFKSSCRKCTCMHPLDSKIRGFLKGCICNPAGRRGECGRYVPTDTLEYLEYLAVMKEESK